MIAANSTTRRWLVAGGTACAALYSGRAFAQSAPPALADGPSLLPMLLAFVLVLGLVPLALWLLKRFNNGLPAAAAGLRIVGQLPLGAQQRLLIVEAGERWLLLGVTGSSISRVGTLPKGALSPESIQPGSFGTLLARFGGRDGQLPRG